MISKVRSLCLMVVLKCTSHLDNNTIEFKILAYTVVYYNPLLCSSLTVALHILYQQLDKMPGLVI